MRAAFSCVTSSHGTVTFSLPRDGEAYHVLSPQPVDGPAESLPTQDDGEIVVGTPGRGASSPDWRRSQSAGGFPTELTIRAKGEGRKRGGAGVKDALGFVWETAKDIAASSSIPFVPEIATCLTVLANLCSDLEDNKKNMPKMVIWCGAMLNILHESNLAKDVSKVGFCAL